MNWANNWLQPVNQAPITPINPRDLKSRDELLVEWQELKDKLAKAKEAEMEMRKYVVSRAFPEPKEGMNTLDLGNGYSLKAGVKFNYKLLENKIVEATLDEIVAIGNEGAFIAERLVSWTPNFLLTEYRNLQNEAKDSNVTAQSILKLVNKMLIIDDAAPTLEIKEPKSKK